MAKASMIPKGGFKVGKLLEAWLNSLADEETYMFSRVISYRATARVLPVIQQLVLLDLADVKWRFGLALSVMRCIALLEVTAQKPNPKVYNSDFELLYHVAIPIVPYSANSIVRTVLSSTRSASGFMGATRSASNSARFASVATEEAANSTVSASNAEAVWAAVTADARALEAGATPEEMAVRPLWPEDSPYKPQFDRKAFLAAAPSFEVWLDWYEPIVDGKAPWGLPRDVANKLEERIALGDYGEDGGKAFWERDADEVNAEIKGWVDAARAEVAAARTKIEVPTTKPASVRASWNAEVLENKPQLTSDLAEDRFQALMSAFKAELSALIREASNNRHSNSVSADAILMLKATRKLIPLSYPNSTCLFRLAVKQEMMLEYAIVVRNEWPNILGSQYRALTVQLGMLLDQTPEVREFRQNATNAELEAITGNEAANAARMVSSELGKKSAKKFIDKSVTTGLNNVADQVDEIISAMPSTRNLPSVVALKTANYDALESTNNILKELIIKAEEGGPILKGIDEFQKAFEEHYPEASRIAGREAAETAAKWAGNTVMAKNAIGILGQNLSLKFPKMFGWISKLNPPESFPGITIDVEADPKDHNRKD